MRQVLVQLTGYLRERYTFTPDCETFGEYHYSRKYAWEKLLKEMEARLAIVRAPE